MGFGFGNWFPIAAAIGVFFLTGFYAVAEKAPYSFTKEATSAPPQSYYDYIVVGGGPAGCAIAATLSTSTAKVLLLERGGLPYDDSRVTNLDGFVPLLLDFSGNSPAQPFVSTDGVFNHRARILGGGTAINAGFYTRASDEYVQQAGWEPLLVEEAYQWVEKKLVFKPRVQQWQAAVRSGLLEAGVLPDRGFTYEHLVGTKTGGTLFDENGYRHTAADLLEYADPEEITVYLHSTVHKVLVNKTNGQRPKAYGVEFKDSKGGRHVVYLNRGERSEIILSAGALGSPQLLMLSDIGPAQQLKALGIEVLLDQQLVGQGMADNPLNTILIPSKKPVEISVAQTVGITSVEVNNLAVDDVGSYIEALSGFVNITRALETALNFAKFVNQTIPIFTIPGFPSITKDINIQAGMIGEKIIGPFSTGHLEIKSLDPNDNPEVTFNYFEDPRDLERCVKGMEIVKRVVESNSMSSFLFPLTSFQSLTSLSLTIPNNLRRRHLSAIFSLEQYCKDNVMSIWHYHGGCQVDRVVDHDYKLIGVDAVRVVDGSTFHDCPGTNPQATLMMLGRYMGQLILQKKSIADNASIASF